MKIKNYFLCTIFILFVFNSNAQNNTTFGFGAGTVLNGQHNSFFGVNAGQNTQTGGLSGNFGKYNVFVGDSAGKQNITGFSNVFVGYNAGINFDNGWQNVFIGSAAGQDAATNRSVHIGTSSGIKSTGSNNSFIGFQLNGRSVGSH